MNTMVCAGVEGGGTDSCEVRAERGPCREGSGRDRFGSRDGAGLSLLWATEDARGKSGDGKGRAVKMEGRLELETVVELGWV